MGLSDRNYGFDLILISRGQSITHQYRYESLNENSHAGAESEARRRENSTATIIAPQQLQT
jgi:hypothetical protein